MAKPKEAPAAATHRFDNITIRVLFVADDPWFYAADVLDAIAAPRSLLDALSDQPSSANTHRDDPLVSETGLHRLLFEADSDAARRFRRWLAAELFPTLYRDEYIARLREMVREAREVSGVDSKTPKRRHLTPEEKTSIVKLKAEGWSIQGLARKFHRGDETIRAVLRGGYLYQRNRGVMS